MSIGQPRTAASAAALASAQVSHQVLPLLLQSNGRRVDISWKKAQQHAEQAVAAGQRCKPYEAALEASPLTTLGDIASAMCLFNVAKSRYYSYLLSCLLLMCRLRSYAFHVSDTCLMWSSHCASLFCHMVCLMHHDISFRLCCLLPGGHVCEAAYI